jgi:hypothetical protein
MAFLGTRAAGSIRGFGFAGRSVSPPTITTQPIDRTVADGSTVTFAVTATGTAPLTYQWYRNGSNVSGANTSSYVFTAVYGNNASYYVVVSNALGSVTSNTVYLTVTPQVFSVGSWNYIDPNKTYAVPSCSNVRIVFIAPGYNPAYTGNSSGGAGGSCFDVNLTVGTGINVNEWLEFTTGYINWYDQQPGYFVRRPNRDTGYIAKLSGSGWSAGSFSTDFSPGNGYSYASTYGGSGGGAYVAYGSYAIAGGGGGGATPSGSGQSGGTPTGGSGGGNWLGYVGNGGEGAPYANWGETVNGSPGSPYGGGGGGQTWSGYSGSGSGFFGVLCT